MQFYTISYACVAYKMFPVLDFDTIKVVPFEAVLTLNHVLAFVFLFTDAVFLRRVQLRFFMLLVVRRPWTSI